MPNLLDTIRQNSQGLATQQQGVTDQTANLQTLLRAKSGKATGSSDSAVSNLGEQSAVAQTNTAMKNQVLPQEQLQQSALDTQATGQQQQLSQAKQGIAQASKFNTIQANLQVNSILADYERQKGQINLDQDKASANQVAQTLRLQNEKYIDNLQMEGDKARLDNQDSFKQQLQSSIFGDNITLLQQKTGDQAILSQNNRDFSKTMSNMSVQTAYDVLKNDMQTNQMRATYGGIGAATTGVIGAYGSAANKSSTTEATPSNDITATSSTTLPASNTKTSTDFSTYS